MRSGRTSGPIAADTARHRVQELLDRAINRSEDGPTYILTQPQKRKLVRLIDAGALEGIVDEIATSSKVRQTYATLLVEMAESNHADVVDALLRAGADIHATWRRSTRRRCLARHGDRGGALSAAARTGATDAVAALLRARASVDRMDDNRRTPLHHAAYGGHLKVISILLEAGAGPLHRDVFGDLPVVGSTADPINPAVAALLDAAAAARLSGVRGSSVKVAPGRTSARGVSSFVRVLVQKNLRHMVIGVRAPAEATSRELASICASVRREEDVRSRLVTGAYAFLATVELRERPWTLIYAYGRQEIDRAQRDAMELSRRLGTDAALLSAFGGLLFAGGACVDRRQFRDIPWLARFHDDPLFPMPPPVPVPSPRPTVQLSPVPMLADADAWANAIGLFVPWGRLTWDGYFSGLALTGLARSDLVRVDLIVEREERDFTKPGLIPAR